MHFYVRHTQSRKKVYNLFVGAIRIIFFQINLSGKLKEQNNNFMHRLRFYEQNCYWLVQHQSITHFEDKGYMNFSILP